ncbi:hypothetical protein SRHO_G00079530 [Serrasalmus rhombeus]
MIALASKLILVSSMSQRIISTQIRQDFLIKERALNVGSRAPQKYSPGQLPAPSIPPCNIQVKNGRARHFASTGHINPQQQWRTRASNGYLCPEVSRQTVSGEEAREQNLGWVQVERSRSLAAADEDEAQALHPVGRQAGRRAGSVVLPLLRVEVAGGALCLNFPPTGETHSLRARLDNCARLCAPPTPAPLGPPLNFVSPTQQPPNLETFG